MFKNIFAVLLRLCLIFSLLVNTGMAFDVRGSGLALRFTPACRNALRRAGTNDASRFNDQALQPALAWLLHPFTGTEAWSLRRLARREPAQPYVTAADGYIAQGERARRIFESRREEIENHEISREESGKLLAPILEVDSSIEESDLRKIKIYEFDAIVLEHDDFFLGHYDAKNRKLYLARDLLKYLQGIGPALANEYVYHEFICPARGHYKAIKDQQRRFPAHYPHLSAVTEEDPIRPYKGRLGTELRSFIDERVANIFRRGDPVEIEHTLPRRVLTLREIQPLISLIDARIRELPPDDQERFSPALSHLRDLADRKKIYLFAEQRWSDTDYLLMSTAPGFISLGEGFFVPQAFSEEERARLLFRAAAASLEIFDPGLENTLFGEPHAFERRIREFSTLTRKEDIQSAITRFTDFREGSPYFETHRLFEAWLNHDIRGFTRLGADKEMFPPVRQGGYLAAALPQLRPGDTQQPLDGSFTSWLESVQSAGNTAWRNIIEPTFAVLLPLACFGIFRGQFFESVRNAIEDNAEIPPLAYLYQSSPHPISASELEERRRYYQGLFKLMVDQPEEWKRRESALSLGIPPGSKAQGVPVPGLVSASIADLALMFELFTDCQVAGLSPLISVVSGEKTNYGLYRASTEEMSASPVIIRPGGLVHINVVDAIPQGSKSANPNWMDIRIDQDENGLLIQLHRQAIFRTLFEDVTGQHLNPEEQKKREIFRALHAVRRAVTPPTLPPGDYAPDGLDLLPWANSILEVTIRNIGQFWLQVRKKYSSFKEFFSCGGNWHALVERNILFWYYTLFTLPDGPFAYIVSHLEFEPDSSRLTAESTRRIIDALTAFCWSGPLRHDATDFTGVILQMLMYFIHLTPDGMHIPDHAAFVGFLTADMLREGHDRPSFEEWVKNSWLPLIADFFPGGADVRTYGVKPYALPDPAPGMAHVVAQPVTDHLAPLPELVSPADLPEAVRRSPGGETAAGVYLTSYGRGVRLPFGPPFRYLITNVNPEERIRVVVRANGEVVISKAFGARRSSEIHLYIQQTESYEFLSGTLGGNQRWERAPIFEEMPAELLHEYHGGDLREFPDGFYSIPAHEGRAVFSFQGRGWSMGPASSSASSAPRLFAQKTGQELALFSETDGLEGRILSSGEFVPGTDGLWSLGERLPSNVQHLPFASVGEFDALLRLGRRLTEAMRHGAGYERVELDPHADEVSLAWPSVRLPRGLLGRLDEAASQVMQIFDRVDPFIHLNRFEAELAQLVKAEMPPSDDHFRGQGLLSERSPLLGLTANSEWPAALIQRFDGQKKNALELRRRLLVARRISRSLVPLRQDMDFHSASRLHQSLMDLLARPFPATGFLFREGLNAYTTPPERCVAGVGYITPDYYRSERGKWVFNARTASGDQSPHLIFVSCKQGSIIPFTEEGDLYDPQSDRVQEQRDALIAKLSEKVTEEDLKRFQSDLTVLLSQGNVTHQVAILFMLGEFLPDQLLPDCEEASLRLNGRLLHLVMQDLNFAPGILLATTELTALLTQWPKSKSLVEHIQEWMLDRFELDPFDPDEVIRFLDHVILPMVGEDLPPVLAGTWQQGLSRLPEVEPALANIWNTLEFLRNAGGEEWNGLLAVSMGLARDAGEPVWPLYRSILDFQLQGQRIEEDEPADETPAVVADRRIRATHLTFFGGGRQEKIDGSALEVRYRDSRVLIDAGLSPEPGDPHPIPLYSLMEHLPNAVFLPHAHLDHIGSALYLYYHRFDQKVPFYATKQTKALLLPALLAMRRIQQRNGGNHHADEGEPQLLDFSENQIRQFVDDVREVERGRDYSIAPDMKIRLVRAGHLLGAFSVMILTPDGNTFISSDMSVQPHEPTAGAEDLPVDIPVHTAVMESTYGMTRPTIDVQNQGKQLVARTLEILGKGGIAIIPAFAMGRSQTVLHALQTLITGEKPTIYIDGEAGTMTKVFRRAYRSLKGDNIHFIADIAGDHDISQEQVRKQILRQAKPCVIISSSGAATFGASNWWVRQVIDHPLRAIFFTGYMGPKELGSRLLQAVREAIPDGAEERMFTLMPGESPVPVRARVEKFSLSGHASGEEILDLVKSMMAQGPLQRLFFVHPGRADIVNEARRRFPGIPLVMKTGTGHHALSGVVDNSAWFAARYADGPAAEDLHVYRENESRERRIKLKISG
jgi:predicted metal-dependent RNase